MSIYCLDYKLFRHRQWLQVYLCFFKMLIRVPQISASLVTGPKGRCERLFSTPLFPWQFCLEVYQELRSFGTGWPYLSSHSSMGKWGTECSGSLFLFTNLVKSPLQSFVVKHSHLQARLPRSESWLYHWVYDQRVTVLKPLSHSAWLTHIETFQKPELYCILMLCKKTFLKLND